MNLTCLTCSSVFPVSKMRVLSPAAEVWSLKEEPRVLAGQKPRTAGSKSPFSGGEHQAQTAVHLKCRSTSYESQKLHYSWQNCLPLTLASFQTGEDFSGISVLL